MYKKLSKEEKRQRAEERKVVEYNKTHKTIDGIIYKWCNHHKEYFPDEDDWIPMMEEYFYKNSSNGIDGFNTYCKKCTLEKYQNYRKEHYDEVMDYMKEYTKFHKKEQKVRRRKSYELNKDREKEIFALFIKNNPDKAKEYRDRHRQHDVTKKEWNECQKTFNHSCAYCGKTLQQQKLENNEQFHKEHVYHQGANDISNCVPSCTNCNSMKRLRTIEQLFEENIIKNFTKEKLDKIKWWITKGYKEIIEEKPPYKIIRKNKTKETPFHYEIWSIDKNRNLIECVGIGSKKEDLNPYINELTKLIKK